MKRARRFVYWVASFFLLFALSACGPKWDAVVVHDAVTVANAATITLESMQTAAESYYRTQQVEIVMSSETREDAESRISVVREKWRAVWAKFEAARKAQRVIVDAVNAFNAGSGPAADVLRAVTALNALYADIEDLVKAAKQ